MTSKLSVKYKKSKVYYLWNYIIKRKNYRQSRIWKSISSYKFFYIEKSIDLARFNLNHECNESSKNELFLFFRLKSNMRKTCHPTQESFKRRKCQRELNCKFAIFKDVSLSRAREFLRREISLEKKQEISFSLIYREYLSEKRDEHGAKIVV